MKKIILLNNWGESPLQYLEHCRQQTINNSFAWDKIVGVTDLSQADYYIVLDGLPNGLSPSSLDPEKTIYLQREPDHVRAFNKPINAKYVYSYQNHATYALWWIKKSFLELDCLRYPKKSKKTVSCILTNKSFTHGQRMRLEFAKLASTELSGKIDYYGNTLINENFGKMYKGGLPLSGPPMRCKYDGLISYPYSLSLENGKLKNFCTRVWEPFLCWTMPIYWGCPNIEDFYPKESYHTIDIEKPDEAIREVADMIQRPISKNNIEAIHHARQLVLYKYNIWPFIQEIINEHR